MLRVDELSEIDSNLTEKYMFFKFDEPVSISRVEKIGLISNADDLTFVPLSLDQYKPSAKTLDSIFSSYDVNDLENSTFTTRVDLYSGKSSWQTWSGTVPEGVLLPAGTKIKPALDGWNSEYNFSETISYTDGVCSYEYETEPFDVPY